MAADDGDKKEPPKPKGDQITNVIGDLGRWHFEKILIVFFASAPGNYSSAYYQHFPPFHPFVLLNERWIVLRIKLKYLCNGLIIEFRCVR